MDFQFNGDNANLITVFRVGTKNALDVSASVREYVENKNLELPSTVKVTAWDDEANSVVELRPLLGMLSKDSYLLFWYWRYS